MPTRLDAAAAIVDIFLDGTKVSFITSQSYHTEETSPRVAAEVNPLKASRHLKAPDIVIPNVAKRSEESKGRVWGLSIP